MEFFEQINNQTTVLTPNRRLSATILKQYQLFKAAQGFTAWETLDILPLNSWIQRFWDELIATGFDILPTVLSPLEEITLWEEVISHSPESEHLLQVSATAESAKSAWSTLKQWNVPLDHPAFTLSENSLVFQQWAFSFKEKCLSNHWIDGSSLWEHIITRLGHKLISLPEKVIIIGFTEFTPQQQNLLTLCEELGCEVIYYEPHRPNTSYRTELQDQETEILTMARWSKACWIKNPTLKIACVFPQLEQYRRTVIRIFSDVFRDKSDYSLNSLDFPFNISAGISLREYPLIHSALKWLHLDYESQAEDYLSLILRSPFIGHAESERFQRAFYEATLRKLNLTQLPLKILLSPTFKYNIQSHCPLLSTRLLNYIKKWESKKNSLLYMDEWIVFFLDLLTELGWPGERSLSSIEFQVAHNFMQLLGNARRLDFFLEPHSFSKALHYIQRLVTKTIFQPQSPDAPIQLLGILESIELSFDVAWIMGLDDNNWPKAPKPNPFIPLSLQKKRYMPNASAEKELTYSQRLTTQLKRIAPQCIFSNAQKTTAAALRPSALITDLEKIVIEEDQLSPFIKTAEYIYQKKELELLADEIGPAVTLPEKIKGGANIFKQQAACPFKAFAEFRLHAKPLELPSLGLRADVKGTLAHKVLELIWKELKNSDTLISTPESEMRNIITKSINQAITYTHLSYPIKNKRYLALEIKRLEKIIGQWLHLEKSRPSFTVLFYEKELTASFNKFSINLRIDRIDELENGKKIIIDYKTGKNNFIHAWFSDRLDEPQLPLYCVTYPNETISIAFAQLHPENMELRGIGKDDINIPSIKQLNTIKQAASFIWEEQIDHWKISLEKLAQNFIEGEATVSPKNPDTCHYCQLHSLCRIHELRRPNL